MRSEILNEPFRVTLLGCGGEIGRVGIDVSGKRYMDNMWQEVRERGVKTKGINHFAKFRLRNSSSNGFNGFKFRKCKFVDDDVPSLGNWIENRQAMFARCIQGIGLFDSEIRFHKMIVD